MVEETTGGTTDTATLEAPKTRRGHRPNTAHKASATVRKEARANARAKVVRTPRYDYRAEADALRQEVQRLRAKLESRPGSPMEAELIVQTVTESYRAGLQTGLLLQGAK